MVIALDGSAILLSAENLCCLSLESRFFKIRLFVKSMKNMKNGSFLALTIAGMVCNKVIKRRNTCKTVAHGRQMVCHVEGNKNEL